MEKKSFTVFFALMSVILLSSMASGSSSSVSTQVATDPANDITELAYGVTPAFDKSKPVIDIISVSYALDTNSNATVTLTLADTPVPSNQTFYWVEFSDDNFVAIAWSGAYDNSGSSSSSECTFACTYLSINGSLGYQTSNATISGKSITWTFPNMVTSYISYPIAEVPANMPLNANSSWSWTALTWTGDSPYSTSGQTSGTWWQDTLDSSSGTDSTNTGTDTSGSKASPGFDLVPVIAFLSASSVAALVQTKRRRRKDL